MFLMKTTYIKGRINKSINWWFFLSKCTPFGFQWNCPEVFQKWPGVIFQPKEFLFWPNVLFLLHIHRLMTDLVRVENTPFIYPSHPLVQTCTVCVQLYYCERLFECTTFSILLKDIFSQFSNLCTMPVFILNKPLTKILLRCTRFPLVVFHFISYVGELWTSLHCSLKNGNNVNYGQ